MARDLTTNSRQAAMNRLLWDFYEDFPLAFSNWVAVGPNEPGKMPRVV